MKASIEHRDGSLPVLEYSSPDSHHRHRLPSRTVGAIWLTIIATALAAMAIHMRPRTSNSLWYIWQWDRFIWMIRLSRIALMLQLYAVVCAFIGSRSDRSWISGNVFCLGIIWLLVLGVLVPEM